MVTSVSAMAISGDSDRDRCRALGALLKHQLHAPLPSCCRGSPAPPINRPSFSRVACACCERLRQAAVKHHRDAVGDLGKFVEVLADHQHGGAAAGKIEQRLADDGGGAGIDAPGRLADHQHAGFAQDFAADDEFLQIAAGQADRFRIALGLAHVEGFRWCVSTVASVAGRVDEAVPAPCRSAACPVSSAFSDSFMRGAVPWPSRSSGTKAAPSRRRSVTERCPAAMAVDHDVAVDPATAARPTARRTTRPGRCRRHRRCRGFRRL